MGLIDWLLHYNGKASLEDLNAVDTILVDRLSAIIDRCRQTNRYKAWIQALIYLPRLADPTPKLFGVAVIIQSNVANRRSGALVLSHQLGFEAWGVLTAFSVRAYSGERERSFRTNVNTYSGST
jgi:hypothetical protein